MHIKHAWIMNNEVQKNCRLLSERKKIYEMKFMNLQDRRWNMLHIKNWEPLFKNVNKNHSSFTSIFSVQLSCWLLLCSSDKDPYRAFKLDISSVTTCGHIIPPVLMVSLLYWKKKKIVFSFKVNLQSINVIIITVIVKEVNIF